VPVMRNGQVIKVWRKLSDHARNEAIDLCVYNLAMAHKLRLHTWSHADWERLRQKLIPDGGTRDLFLQPAAPPPADLSTVVEPESAPAPSSVPASAVVAEAPAVSQNAPEPAPAAPAPFIHHAPPRQ